METAFQADAFQNNAFQIGVSAPVSAIDGRPDDEEIMELLLIMDA